ncbi:MAG: periplasmic heavy metal sensor [Candidatus Brevundimonas colombiensis]|uniref:Periplasmic heavy metal sensor n=1 Tax=Candidatus Brevundimonas colombiensis TaxID=3121376 RepID=A0AAJ5X6N4_9CAUL|nr:periplasmic heavy metal sensor [Brevundimonas sp.]WEK41400.1 MAG: periplasmic heavy metal sensor [Brevundimonas sp.]
MTNKTLKIALAVSVALNLFAVAGGVTYIVGRDKIERRIEEQRRGGREGPLADVLAGLDPAVRQRVRATLRETALTARPDFEAARAARREAIAVAGQPTLDAPRVQALLEQSRDAEMRGRQRLERGAVALLATLTPEERKAMTPLLQRKGGARRDAARHDGPEARSPETRTQDGAAPARIDHSAR